MALHACQPRVGIEPMLVTELQIAGPLPHQTITHQVIATEPFPRTGYIHRGPITFGMD
jgi:hypothetical protein